MSRLLQICRLTVILFSLYFGLFQSHVLAQTERPAKPNILILLADDLGWQDLKCYDIDAPSVFETPYIDALADEGVLFWQAYSPSPTCSPSRGAILSGKHPARINRTHVFGGTAPKPHSAGQRMMEPFYKGRLDFEEVTIAEALAPQGYFSGHVGKWHVAISHNAFPQPMDQGFDWTESDRGVTSSMGNRRTGFATSDPSDPYQLDANGFAFDQTTYNALSFLTEAVTGPETLNRPFFLYYASWLVHTPIQMRTESLLIKYAGKMGYDYPLNGTEFFAEGQNNPYYAAMVETFDYNVHQIVSYLKNTDDPRWPGHTLFENTYIFLTSDNGGMERSSGEYITDNYPLDEGKIRAEEGGTRVPFIALGPDISAGLESNVMINGMDLFPTILSMAGVTLSGTIDGCDLSDLLRTDPQEPTLVKDLSGAIRDTMYWHFPQTSKLYSTIRKNGWKLFKNYDHLDNSGTNPFRLYELYNEDGTRKDIEEASDVIFTDTSAIGETLEAELDDWLVEVDAAMPSYSPKYSGTLTNIESVPVVLDKGNGGGVAWVTYETDKAEVVRADLIYTLNGGETYEEWFKTSASIVSPGRAEATIPDGTTHYVFNLIDENDFLVSSEDVGFTTDGLDDSSYVPLYVYRYVYVGPEITLYSFDFSSETLSTGNSLLRGSTGFVKRSDSAWSVSGGVLSNSSSVNSRVSEGAVAQIFDVSQIADESFDEIIVNFDYTLSEEAESLVMHLWGLVDAGSTVDTAVMNLGATNGNAWEQAVPEMTAYNLGQANGAFSATAGDDSDAAIVISGETGSHTLSHTFVLSEFTTAPNNLSAYDYLVVGFTRNFGGNAPAASIDNLKLSVPNRDGYVVWAFEAGLNDDDIESDPDLDGISNLMEYGLGGDPNQSDSDVFPYLISNSENVGEWEFVYRRRLDASTEGLIYTPLFSETLNDASWSGSEITETKTDIIDQEFESVTNTIQIPEKRVGFFRLQVEKNN